MHALPDSSVYRTILIATLLLSFWVWSRRVKSDKRLLGVYLGGVLGGFTGAKLVYILAEGWLRFGEPNVWLHLAAGKTIVGALLGGYLGIEIAKSVVGFKKATGDWFALIVPLGIAAGRIGCFSAGCCLGVEIDPPTWFSVEDAAGQARWPAPIAELSFNLLMVAILFPMRRAKFLPGQLFHLYLISYGAFRFIHEFWRATEKPFVGLSGYQLAALGLVTLGGIRFWQRQKVATPVLDVN